MPTVTTAATSTTQATASAVNDPESTAVNDPEINDPESTHDPIIPIRQSAGQQAQQLLVSIAFLGGNRRALNFELLLTMCV